MGNIFQLVKTMGESRKISADHVISIKMKYLNLYRNYMLRLYDMGYISDPTYFNEEEIRKDLLDLNIRNMVLCSGEISLDSRIARFALDKGVTDEDQATFLKLLERALYYREMSHGIDKFWDSFKFVKTDTKKLVSVKLGIVVSGSAVVGTKGFPIVESVMEAVTKGNNSIACIDAHQDFWDLCCKEIGIQSNEDGLFINGMTHENELKYCDLIFNGMISLDGKESGKLKDWLKGHKWSSEIDDKYITQKSGLYSYVVRVKNQEIQNIQNNLVKVIEERGLKAVGAHTDCIYYAVKEDKKPFIVSPFSVIIGNDEVMCGNRNRLEGYMGEAYPVDYLEDNDILYNGSPIVLWTEGNNRNEKGLFVDFEQVGFSKKKYKTWFSYNEAVLDFDDRMSLDERLGLENEDADVKEMWEVVKSSLNEPVVGSIRCFPTKKEEDEVKLKVAKYLDKYLED